MRRAVPARRSRATIRALCARARRLARRKRVRTVRPHADLRTNGDNIDDYLKIFCRPVASIARTPRAFEPSATSRARDLARARDEIPRSRRARAHGVRARRVRARCARPVRVVDARRFFDAKKRARAPHSRATTRRARRLERSRRARGERANNDSRARARAVEARRGRGGARRAIRFPRRAKR